MAKKLTVKEKKEIELKDKLRTRVRDMAAGSGMGDVDCGDYWSLTADCLGRLMSAISNTFQDQVEELQVFDAVLERPWTLSNYTCLDDLTGWLFEMGFRA